MTKTEAIRKLVKLIAPNDAREQARLTKHHKSRTAAQVRESLGRQGYLVNMSPAEERKLINENCRFEGLPRLGK